MHGRTDTRTDGQRENSIPTTNKVCRGYKNVVCLFVFGQAPTLSKNPKHMFLMTLMPDDLFVD